MTTRYDAVVLGAGLAGLSAATQLAERGLGVLVVEARPAAGGRATAFADSHTGDRVDNGQHALFGCYHEALRFLRRVGAEGSVRVQPDLAVDLILPDGRASRLVCPPLPSPLHLAAAVLDWDVLPWRDRASVLRMRKPLARAKALLRKPGGVAAASPSETVAQWLVRNGQAPRLISWLWEPLALAALNQSIYVAAAVPFARILALMFGGDRRDAALVMPTRPLDEMYVTPALEFLRQRGGEVRTGSPARIFVGEDGSARVTAGGQTISAPVVISAVPWFELPQVLAAVPALAPVVHAASRTAASPIVTVNLWFDRAVFGRSVVGLPGRTMQWAFEKPSVVGDGCVHVSLVSSGADDMLALANDRLAALALAEVIAAVPRASAATLRRSLVVRERRATFSLAPDQPSRPNTRTGVRGLFLAGDWIETGLPATLEGAALSGHQAAAAATISERAPASLLSRIDRTGPAT